MFAGRFPELRIALLGFVAVGVLWAVLIPPFEAPDEINHLAYVLFVTRTGRLPVQTQENMPFLDHEAHQPPLYYVAAAGVVRVATALGLPTTRVYLWRERINPNYIGRTPARGGDPNFWIHEESISAPSGIFPYDLLLVRLFSVFLAAVALAIMHSTSLAIWPGDRVTGVTAVGLLAFLPQFSFITASANNDVMAILAGSAILYQVVRILRAEAQRKTTGYLLLGALLGAGLLTKLTMFSLLPIAFLLPLFVGAGRRHIVSAWLLSAVGILAVSGWWFLRNMLLYNDLLGDHWKVNPAYFAWDLDPKSLLSPYFRDKFWKLVAESLVGKFGFNHLAMPSIFYQIYLLTFLVGFGGALPLLWRKSKDRIARSALSLFLAAFLIATAQLIYLNLRVSQPQGRYLFHAMPGIALVLAAGYTHLRSHCASRSVRWGNPKTEMRWVGIQIGLTTVGMVALSLLALLGIYGIYFP